LPLWSRAATNLTAAVEIEDDLIAGIRNADWVRIPFDSRYVVGASFESPISRVVSVSLRLAYSGMYRALYLTPLVPSLNLNARW
jgi:hypothetical protein